MVDSEVIYAVTRVKARKSNLLDMEEYSKMMQMDDTVLARYIGDLGYSEEFSELFGKVHPHELIERGVIANMANEFTRISGFCKGKLQGEITAYLGRLDIQNILMVLRHSRAGQNAQPIEREIIPFGIWREKVDLNAYSKAGLNEILNSFSKGYWFSPIVRKTMVETESNSLGFIEDSLQKGYYAHLTSVLKKGDFAEKHFLRFVRAEIDIINIQTAVKFLGRTGNVESIKRRAFIPNGKDIDEKIFKDLMSAGTPERLFQIISGFDILSTNDEIRVVEDPIQIARMIAKGRIAVAQRFSGLYPLSVLPIIHYLIMKEREVENLRIIVRGKERELPDEMIRDLLVI